MTKKDKKIYQIVADPDIVKTMSLSSLLKAVENGISLNEEKRLFLIVREVLRYENKKELYIEHVFKQDLKFLKKNFKGIRT